MPGLCFQKWFFQNHIPLGIFPFKYNCFWGDLGWISSKRHIPVVGALLSGMVFQNHIPLRNPSKTHFELFWKRFSLNLFKNHPPFGNSAFGGGFSPMNFWEFCFLKVFFEKLWFLNSFRLNLFKNHPPFGNSAFGGGFSPIPFWEFCLLERFSANMWFLNSFKQNLFENHPLFTNPTL